jgi:hypothetical protein
LVRSTFELPELMLREHDRTNGCCDFCHDNPPQGIELRSSSAFYRGPDLLRSLWSYCAVTVLFVRDLLLRGAPCTSRTWLK